MRRRGGSLKEKMTDQNNFLSLQTTLLMIIL